MASDLEGLRQAEVEAQLAVFVAARERQPLVGFLYTYREAVEARVRAEVEEEGKQAIRKALEPKSGGTAAPLE